MKSLFQTIGKKTKLKKNNFERCFFFSYYYKKPDELLEKNLKINWFPKNHLYRNHQLFGFFLKPRAKLKNAVLNKRSKKWSKIIENLHIKNYSFKTIFLQFQEFYLKSLLNEKFCIFVNSLSNLSYYVPEKKLLNRKLKSWVYLIENKNKSKKYQIILTKNKRTRIKADPNLEKCPKMFYFYDKNQKKIGQKNGLFNLELKIEKTLSNQWVTFKKNKKFKSVIFQFNCIVKQKRLFFLFKKTKLNLRVPKIKSIINIVNQSITFSNSKFI